VVSRVKLIAEPWDVGEGGYQVGNFPVLWTEWNGPYRDTVRDYWRGVAPVGDFATRFAGSADLYERDGRRPFASINFVTAHDGFTLADLVSYNEKHNEANLEDNNDGTDDNRSWNCGVEGPTDDAEVLALRARQQRNFLSTLFLSQGVPMLLAGDEMGRSQGGNNNAYCQDNAISWFDWDLGEADRELLEFTRRLIEFRHDHPVLRRETFFGGEPDAQGLPDIWWFRPDGRRMARRDWQQPGGPVAVFLNGDAIRSLTPQGDAIHDDSLILLLNAGHEPVEFMLPPRRFGAQWRVELSTIGPDAEGREYAARTSVSVTDRSVTVLSRLR
jgi:glycogen operon protein